MGPERPGVGTPADKDQSGQHLTPQGPGGQCKAPDTGNPWVGSCLCRALHTRRAHRCLVPGLCGGGRGPCAAVLPWTGPRPLHCHSPGEQAARPIWGLVSERPVAMWPPQGRPGRPGAPRPPLAASGHEALCWVTGRGEGWAAFPLQLWMREGALTGVSPQRPPRRSIVCGPEGR